MTQPIGEEFIRIRPSLEGFRAELQAQLAAALAGVQPQIAAATARAQRTAAAATPAAPAAQTAAARAANEAAARSSLVVASSLAEVRAASDAAAEAQQRLAAAAANTQRQLGGVVLPAGIRDVVTASEAAAAAQERLARTARVTREQLGAIVLPAGIQSVVVESDAAAAAQGRLAAAAKKTRAELASSAAAAATGVIRPAGFDELVVGNREAARVQRELAAAQAEAAAAEARAAETRTQSASSTRKAAQEERLLARALAETAAAAERSGIVLASSLRGITAQSQAAATAQQRLAAAATATNAELGGLVLPAGVRDAVTSSRAAAAAQETLARATRVTKEELRGIVLPAGLRSIVVESDAAAAAQTRLGTAAQATTRELAGVAASATAAGAALRAGETATAGGVIIPAGFGQTTGANRQAAADAARSAQSLSTTQTAVAATTNRANDALRDQAESARRAQRAGDELSRTLKEVETDTGRFARGTIAATAASTGFFRAVSFASGAFLFGAALGATIGTAVNEFKAMTQIAAQTNALIRATGEIANVTAGDVSNLADQQLKLTGIDDELIKQSANVILTFKNIRNEVGPMNDIFDRAVVAVEDISTVFGTSMRSSAIQVGKALQDPIRGVTALRRSGITLTQGQRDLIKSLQESGRTLAAQKIILREIETQVGGTAEAVGDTLPGRLAILREESKNSLGEFVQRLSESETATRAFTESFGGAQEAFHTAAAAITPFLEATGGLVKVLDDLGVIRPLAKALTTLAIAYTAVRIATTLATAASNAYTRATTIETTVLNAKTNELEKSTARIGIGAAALRGLAGPIGITIGITAATIGLEKLHDITSRLPGSLNATRNALQGLNDALQRQRELSSGLAGAREDVSIARFDVQAARRRLAAAQAAQAASAAPAESLTGIHLQRETTLATEALREATQKLAQAEQARNRIVEQQDAIERQRPGLIAETTKRLREQVQAQIAGSHIVTLGGFPIGFSFDRVGGGLEAAIDKMQKLGQEGDKTAAAVAAIMTTLDRPLTPKQLKVVVSIIAGGGSTNTAVRRILGIEPSTEQIRLRGFQITTPGQQQEDAFLAANAALKEQEGILKTLRNTEGATAAELRKAGILRSQGLKQTREELRVRQQTVAADKESVRNAREALANAVRSLSDARQSYRDAVGELRDTITRTHQSIVDAVTASRRAVTQAVQSAKDNLQSLGQQLASTLDSFAEAGGRFGLKIPQGLDRALQPLRDQILRGQGGPETQQGRERVQFLLDNQGATPKTEDLQRKFDDLSFDLSTGAIKNMREFNRRLNAIVGNLDPQKLKATLGSAAAGSFIANLKAFRQQAAAILTGPQRPGGPGAAQVISPAEALRQGAKEIHDARVQGAKDIQQGARAVSEAAQGIKDAEHDVKEAHRNLAQALDKLRQDQVEATKAQTAATKANTRAANQLKDVLKARGFLVAPPTKPKPKGDGGANQNATTVVGKGAAAP